MQTTVDVFSSRDLRSKAGKLIKEAQAGHLSIITTHGRPAAIALPFNARLMEQGAHHHLAATLFEQKQVTLVQAAKIAALSVEEFLEVLNVSNIDAVDYPVSELADEESVFAGRSSSRGTSDKPVRCPLTGGMKTLPSTASYS